jgi:hypothetical protein
MENNHVENEPFYFDEKVDVVNDKTGVVEEATIVSIRGNIFVVRYSATNEEDNVNLYAGKIIKQCKPYLYNILGKPGRPLRRFNRVDIKSTHDGRYYEGVVMRVEGEKVLVKYRFGEKFVEEWVSDLKNIAPIGKYTGRFNPNLHTADDVNKILFFKKKFFKPNETQEDKFSADLKKVNLRVKEIAGDGNCLYRAIAHQVYGDENFYEITKSKCLDYLELEKDFFSMFIEDGKDKFEDYISMKRINGVWGDDIEIQALSELYNRPIEIFSHSIEPLKTFHENTKGFARYDGERQEILPAIKISYHGSSHYNSLIPIDNYSQFKTYMVKSKPGDYENNVLEKVKVRKLQEKEKHNMAIIIPEERLEASRESFLEKSKISELIF